MFIVILSCLLFLSRAVAFLNRQDTKPVFHSQERKHGTCEFIPGPIKDQGLLDAGECHSALEKLEYVTTDVPEQFSPKPVCISETIQRQNPM